MWISWDCAKRTLKLDQISYATKVIECFKLNNAKVTCTPLSLGYNPAPNPKTTTPQLHSHYQSVIGLLLYIMLGTHSDTAFSVIKMSQFSSNPSGTSAESTLYCVIPSWYKGSLHNLWWGQWIWLCGIFWHRLGWRPGNLSIHFRLCNVLRQWDSLMAIQATMQYYTVFYRSRICWHDRSIQADILNLESPIWNKIQY